MSITANVLDRMFRWPTVTVAQPSAQSVPATRDATVSSGNRNPR